MYSPDWEKEFDEKFPSSFTSINGKDYIDVSSFATTPESLKDFIRSLLHSHNESLKEVIPFLRAYKNVLASDWDLHPVQSNSAVYISPEQSLRNAADEIENKRKMETQLEELIKRLSLLTNA